MKKIRFIGLLCVLLLAPVALSAQVQKMLGEWVTVDDNTGEQKAVVTIYRESDGLYYGKISQLLIGDPTWTCTPCKGEDYKKPIVGLVIIRGLSYNKDKDYLEGGKVLDPESGKFYYGKIFLKNGQLVLRGSLDKRGFLGRNQTWVRK